MSPSANRSPAASPSAAARASENGTSASRTAAPAQHRIQSATPGRIRRLVGLARVDEREREQHEPDEGDDDGHLLPAREPARMTSGREEREHGDPAGADGLHERERRQPQRGDVDDPAGGLGTEREAPPGIAEQRPDEPNRLPRREARHRRRRVVLLRIRPVDRESRDEGERQSDPRPHRPFLPVAAPERDEGRTRCIGSPYSLGARPGRRKAGEHQSPQFLEPPPHRGPRYDDHRRQEAASPIAEPVVHSIGSLDLGSGFPPQQPTMFRTGVGRWAAARPLLRGAGRVWEPQPHSPALPFSSYVCSRF